MRILFAFISLPLLAVAARLIQLQVWLVDDYVAAFNATTESLEPIASTDGRISTADGRILAEDVERFDVSVHYRWLEEPPDPHWLSRQALATLSRKERRNRDLVQRAKKRVLERRAALWRRLAELSGDPASLARSRTLIQQRVERIARSVAARAQSDSDAIANNPLAANLGPRWVRIWNTVRDALTTPPQRDDCPPVIVREVLDYHRVIDEVPLAIRAEIEGHPLAFPGVRVGRSSRRIYHDSRFAPQLIGTRTSLSDDDMAQRTSQFGPDDPLDYRQGDRKGRTGIEAAYDAHLRGLRGLRRVVRNRYGEILSETTLRNPHPGKDVEITLNTAVQRNMEQLLDRTVGVRPPQSHGNGGGKDARDSIVPSGGCIVALDVHSGAILVAASAPRCDLGPFGIPTPSDWERFTSDPRHPLMERVTQMTLPPGSVFKVVSAAALLEGGRIDPDQRFDCQGYLERPDRLRCLLFAQQGIGHGPVNLADALARSCNVYFFHASDVVGPQAISTWGTRLGFGRATGVDLPFERGGQLPIPDAPELAGRWHLADTRALAIGQSTLTVTPLQVARMMAAIANGGYLVEPFVGRKSGPQLDEDSAAVLHPRAAVGLSESTLARLRAGLERTVADPAGTGYKTVRLESIRIAGKSGTAQVGGGQGDHAWFAGYVPAENPRIAFAVVLEHAGSGGRTAGPLARQLVEAFLADGTLQPARVTLRN